MNELFEKTKANLIEINTQHMNELEQRKTNEFNKM